MKEIKAYIRPERIDAVVHALEDAGFSNMTIIDVAALGELCDPERVKYSIEFVERHSRIVKLEIVVADVDVDRVVRLIMEHAHTGWAGDGMVYVTPVDAAYRIRSKAPLHPVPSTA